MSLVEETEHPALPASDTLYVMAPAPLPPKTTKVIEKGFAPVGLNVAAGLCGVVLFEDALL